jgi:curli biogenesis system outer membrane secretion channel CsgG
MLLLIVAICVASLSACAGTSASNTPAQNAQAVTLDAGEAAKQLAGASTAIATLTPQLPDQAAAGQINNYLAWANVAAQALGIVAQAVAPVL